MKTAVDINAALIEQAKRVLNTRTIRETVDQSLRAVVRQGALDDLAKAAGSMNFDVTAGDLRRQRRKRTSRASR